MTRPQKKQARADQARQHKTIQVHIYQDNYIHVIAQMTNQTQGQLQTQPVFMKDPVYITHFEVEISNIHAQSITIYNTIFQEECKKKLMVLQDKSDLRMGPLRQAIRRGKGLPDFISPYFFSKLKMHLSWACKTPIFHNISTFMDIFGHCFEFGGPLLCFSFVAKVLANKGIQFKRCAGGGQNLSFFKRIASLKEIGWHTQNICIFRIFEFLTRSKLFFLYSLGKSPRLRHSRHLKRNWSTFVFLID